MGPNDQRNRAAPHTLSAVAHPGKRRTTLRGWFPRIHSKATGTRALAHTQLISGAMAVGASNGQVAVSAFGSGCACPTAVIAICPIRQCSAEPQLEVCSAVHGGRGGGGAVFNSGGMGGQQSPQGTSSILLVTFMAHRPSHAFFLFSIRPK